MSSGIAENLTRCHCSSSSRHFSANNPIQRGAENENRLGNGGSVGNGGIFEGGVGAHDDQYDQYGSNPNDASPLMISIVGLGGRMGHLAEKWSRLNVYI